ncbi:MAG: NUDIX domain-containing protein [Oscillospiraceae bacterium]
MNELLGGGILTGETTEQTALRELKEECGLDGAINRPLYTLYWIDSSTEYVFLVDAPDDQ